MASMDLALYNIAATNGNVNNVGQLDLRLQVTRQRNTVLHVAVKYGNPLSAQQILHAAPYLLRQTNIKGDTPLHVAARLGNLEMVRTLLTTFAVLPVLLVEAGEHPLRIVNVERNTALHEAVKNCHYEIVDFLIQQDPSLTLIVNDKGESPLFLAVDRQFYTIARRILQTFPNCSYSGRNGMTVMHAATIRSAVRNDVDIVNHINQTWGYEILKVQDDSGWTPLHCAAHLGIIEFVQLFLQNNYSLAYITDKKGMSALHISAKNGQYEVVSMLIERCPDVCELLDNKGRTALHVAAKRGWSYVVKVLLKTRAYNHLLNEKDNEGNTSLHLAAARGSRAILKILTIDRRVDTGAINNAGMTALDIIRSDLQLSPFFKAGIISLLKTRGVELNLERVIFRKTRVQETVETKGHEISQNNTNLTEVAGIGKAAGSDTSSKAAEKRELLIKNTAHINLLVATIVASITFSAAIGMPGGYGTADGLAVLRKRGDFKIFLQLDTLAFGCSAGSMVIHFLFGISSIFMPHIYFSYPLTSVYLITLFFIMSAVGAFFFSIRSVLTIEAFPVLASSVYGIVLIFFLAFISSLSDMSRLSILIFRGRR